MKKLLTLLDSVLLVVVLVTLCSQVEVGRLGADTYKKHGFVTKQLHLSLGEMMLMGTLVWFAISTSLRGGWRKLWWPPFCSWAFLLVLFVAAIHSQSVREAVGGYGLQHHVHGLASNIKSLVKVQQSREALADLVQFSLFFIWAPWLFVNLMRDQRDTPQESRRFLALIAVVAAVGLVLLVGLLQLRHGPDAPKSLFESPNAYNGFLAFILPFVTVLLASRRQIAWAVVGLVLLVIAVLSMASIWAVLALLIGLLVAALFAAGPVRMRVACCLVGTVILLPFAWPLTLPLRHDTINIDRFGKTHAGPITLEQSRADSLHLASQAQPVKKQFVEWYAAVGMARPREKAFATGVGPGNYQLNIGPMYASLPNEEKMPPDSNNLYLVQAMTGGFLGLAALLWVLATYLHQARLASGWYSAGLCGSLAAFTVVNLFHALLVRGTGVLLAFLFALAVVTAREAGSKDRGR